MSGDYGMDGFMQAITGASGLTSDTIWGVITPLVPLIITGVTVGLGVYIFRRISKGLSKGKFKV